MISLLRLAALSAVLIGGLAGTATQAQTTSPSPSTPDRSIPPPAKKDAVPDTGSGSSNLSHELSRSGGVIEPPATGDRGVVAPPSVGTQSTPVIPPPGTPGGNPDVKPK